MVKINNGREKKWDDVYSIKGGQIVEVGKSSSYGNYVVVEDEDGVRAMYGHLANTTLSEGDSVQRGECIGQMGGTGRGEPVPNKHLHVSVYTTESQQSGTKFYQKNINPVGYILDGGAWPCNTTISGSYCEVYGTRENDVKWNCDNFKGYPHEGVDFSGKIANLIPGWSEVEIDPKLASQGYDLYEGQLDYKNQLEKEFDGLIAKATKEAEKEFEKLNKERIEKGEDPLTKDDLKNMKESAKKSVFDNYSKIYTNKLVVKDNQIDFEYDLIQEKVAKDLAEYYEITKFINNVKQSVLPIGSPVGKDNKNISDLARDFKRSAMEKILDERVIELDKILRTNSKWRSRPV